MVILKFTKLKLLSPVFFLLVSPSFSETPLGYKKSISQNWTVGDQLYVNHSNGNLWMGWDSYGNTGDQTCSAMISGWMYPGGSYLNYNCRAGYWIVGKIGDDYMEGATGEYVLSRGTEPGPVSQGWENSTDSYSKEPWLSTVVWTIPTLGLKVKAERRSWSFQGSENTFFKIGEFDYNDFVIEEMTLTNTGPDDISDLVVGSKADHDVTWNVPNPDWDFPFWTDDIIDYDPVSMTTMQLDGDDQNTAKNDFGIDDPERQYRGVRVGQTPISLNGKNHDELTATDVTHYWWTGDEDPQTAGARWTFATKGSRGEDKKTVNPSPLDMRYLQAYGPYDLAAGDSIKLVFAVLAGSGLENIQNAAKNAKQTFDWQYNLPKPPPSPQMDVSKNKALSDGSIKIWWQNLNENAVDPDKGEADFDGYKIYRSVKSDSISSSELFAQEGITADNIDPYMIGNLDGGTAYRGSAVGPFSLVKDIPSLELDNYRISDTEYEWTDTNTSDLNKHWYYVSAYDRGGSDPVHGTVSSLESFRTLVYPMSSEYDPYGMGEATSPLHPIISVSNDYTVIETNVSGTLTSAESPYVIKEDIVTDGLVIVEQGVEIIFIENATLSGTFSAQGTETNPIKVTKLHSNIQGSVTNTGSSTFSYCDLEGVSLNSDKGTLSLDHANLEEHLTVNNSTVNISYTNIGRIYADSTTGKIQNSNIEYYSSYQNCDELEFTNNHFNRGGNFFSSNNLVFKNNVFTTANVEIEISRYLMFFGCSNVLIHNNTFSNFKMAEGEGHSIIEAQIGGDNDVPSSLDVRNNIFWNIVDASDASILYSTESDIKIEYNDIQRGKDEVYGEYTWGEGNIDEDPLFVDSDNGDFQLQIGSPCIDAGDPNSPVDRDGTRNDMGAFDLIQEFSVYPGDTDNNGIVNELDVLPIGIYFHKTGPSASDVSYAWETRTVTDIWDDPLACYADVNGDGNVDEVDVVGIGVNWGNVHDVNTSLMTIDFQDSTLIRSHKNDFLIILNSLKGESEPTSAIRKFLAGIIDIPMPHEFFLHQNYPNPFNHKTNIKFDLPYETQVSLTVYNLLGQPILTPIYNQFYSAGFHIASINLNNLSSGLYIYKFDADTWHDTRKMLLLK